MASRRSDTLVFSKISPLVTWSFGSLVTWTLGHLVNGPFKHAPFCNLWPMTMGTAITITMINDQLHIQISTNTCAIHTVHYLRGLFIYLAMLRANLHNPCDRPSPKLWLCSQTVHAPVFTFCKVSRNPVHSQLGHTWIYFKSLPTRDVILASSTCDSWGGTFATDDFAYTIIDLWALNRHI